MKMNSRFGGQNRTGLALKTNLILGAVEMGSPYKICRLNCFFDKDDWGCLNTCETLMGPTDT